MRGSAQFQQPRLLLGSPLPRFLLLSTSGFGITFTFLALHFCKAFPRRPVDIDHTPSGQGEVLYYTLMSVAPSAGNFTELMHLGDPIPRASPLPLSKISFVISSCPGTHDMLSQYLGWWKSGFGSELIRQNPGEPPNLIYWGQDDTGVIPPDFNIRRSNCSNYHRKWANMGFDAAPLQPGVDWFVLMDDDTLPFVDNIARFLAAFPNPRQNYYFFHGPGERKSDNRLGNGGSGFYISRKLMVDAENFSRVCIQGMARRILNGDIRLDTCLRRFLDRNPDFVTAMFHLDPKVLQGDLTGLIEGFATKVGLLALHHIDKVRFRLFPKRYMKHLSDDNPLREQTRIFYQATGTLGENFLTRHVLKLSDNRSVILNEGYSVVFFPDSQVLPVVNYLMGVERTFKGTPFNLYSELLDLLIEPNPKLVRYYLKTIETDGNGVISEEYALAEDLSATVVVLRKGKTVMLQGASLR